VTLRDHHAFEQRKATIEAILDDLGPTRSTDVGRSEDLRRFKIEVDAPQLPLVAQARFRYLEWWRRDGSGWRRVKSYFDYIDLVHGGRLAYHRHDLPGAAGIPHSHCEPANRPSTAPHFRAYEVDLLEAHEEFTALYASGRPIDCVGLRPLRTDHEGADA
jgi:hypothetical protein